VRADGKNVNILHPPVQAIEVLRRTLGSHYTILRDRASLENTDLQRKCLPAALIVLSTLQETHRELQHVSRTCLLERRGRVAPLWSARASVSRRFASSLVETPADGAFPA
jgi:hypothetical protein